MPLIDQASKRSNQHIHNLDFQSKYKAMLESEENQPQNGSTGENIQIIIKNKNESEDEQVYMRLRRWNKRMMLLIFMRVVAEKASASTMAVN